MERLEKITYVGEELEIDRDVIRYKSIDELTSFINIATLSGATHIQFSGTCYSEGYVDCIDLQPISIEIESDESYNRRLEQDRINTLAWEKRVESEEIIKYKELKNKYEGKI